MSQNRLLIVHPDESVRALMSSMLQTMGPRILEVPTEPAAVRMMEHDPVDLILAAAEPTNPDALEFLNYLRRKHPRTAAILLFTAPHQERTREAMMRGAAAVLRFPLPATHLRAAVAQALPLTEPTINGKNAAKPAEPVPPVVKPTARPASPAEGSAAAQDLEPARGAEPDIVGEDPSLRQAVELAGMIAPTRAPVLIVGERGTGKTLLARRLHARSPRRDGPLVELSCAALKELALEVELFGRKGAPGEADRPGRLAQLQGGTLFLDEVAALSPGLQFKLFRLLRDGEYEPVGSNQTARADVRLILGTRDDLTPLVEKDQFRSDLYYRVSVITLKLPPLRHRGADIERLAEHLRGRFARTIGQPAAGFAPEALEVLRGHDWPGNVWELAQVVERAVVLCRGARIEPEHLIFTAREPSPSRIGAAGSRAHAPLGILPLKEALEGPEKQLILQALQALNWNRQETARVLDINRTTLYKKMKKYGLLYDEPVWVN